MPSHPSRTCIPDTGLHNAFEEVLHWRKGLPDPDLQGALSTDIAHALQKCGVDAVRLDADLYASDVEAQDLGYLDRADAEADGVDLFAAHLLSTNFQAWGPAGDELRTTPVLARTLLPVLQHLVRHWSSKKRWLPPRTSMVRLEWRISTQNAAMIAIGYPEQVERKRTRRLTAYHISRNILPERVANFTAALQQLAKDGATRVDLDIPNALGGGSGEPEFSVDEIVYRDADGPRENESWLYDAPHPQNRHTGQDHLFDDAGGQSADAASLDDVEEGGCIIEDILHSVVKDLVRGSPADETQSVKTPDAPTRQWAWRVRLYTPLHAKHQTHPVVVKARLLQTPPVEQAELRVAGPPSARP